MALEQALTNSQAEGRETQKQLTMLLNSFQRLKKFLGEQQTPPTPPTIPVNINPIQATPTRCPPPPALPTKFDGDQTHGQAFLNSCQTYICLCSDSFPSNEIKITWVLSYMKSGRAAKWAARVFKWEEDNKGYPKFLDWDEFQTEFQKDFCLAHVDVAAINKLESTTYYQKTRSVNNYLDEFLDLIMEVGYMDLKITVVKFRKGLDPQIQNTIATMAYGRPSDSIPDAWYKAAKNVDQNWAANKAFKLASHTPIPACMTSSVPIHPGPPSLSWILPLVMKVNSTPANLTPFNCYWYHKPGHLAVNCPQKHNIHTLSVEEIEMALMGKRDMAKIEDLPVEVKKADLEDFVQDNKWKACPCCPHVIILRY